MIAIKSKFRAADCDTDHYLVVVKIRERIAVNKQGSHTFHMESFNLKKLNGKPEGKRPLGRPRRRWIDNIKMDLLETTSVV
jgi:hypothetical protein